MNDNIAAFVERTFKDMWSKFVFRAVVTGTSGNKVFIRRRPTDSPDDQSYARLSSYSSPTVDDEVLVIWLGGWLVVGKVIR